MPLGKKAQAEHRTQCQRAIDAFAKHGTQMAAAGILGIPHATIQHRIMAAERMGLTPTYQPLKAAAPAAPKIDLLKAIPKAIRKSALSAKDLAERFSVSEEDVRTAVGQLQTQGVSVHEMSGRYEIMPPPQGSVSGRPRHAIYSDKDGWFKFGVIADNHLGSKYERLDVLEHLYKTFAEEDVETVFNLGNYIEGEARFNKHELLVHGMDAQCRYLAQHYPQRKGITTYAVTGDDHEGWYAQREGVDVGKYVERVMRDAGRKDWVDLGYMNAYIRMVNKKTKAEAVMEICHPGGGSAYADSYAVQKAIEAMEGGEKPAIWLGGHYHKMISVNYRNVWCFLCGCTKDLDTFGRKKKLRYVIGGAIVDARQDPDTGAITRFRPDMLQYFNRGYYDGRWSHSGLVNLPERV